MHSKLYTLCIGVFSLTTFENHQVDLYGKMYRPTAKFPQLLNKAMEEQSTGYICIAYQGQQNSSVLLTNERCTEQLEWTPYDKMYKRTPKINLRNFQIKWWRNNLLVSFAHVAHQGKQNGSVLFSSKWMMYGAVTKITLSYILTMKYTKMATC